MTLEGRGLDLYSRQDEAPHLNPQYDSMQKERLQPPPIGTFYTPPATSAQINLGTDSREKQREGNRERGREKERDRGRNWGSRDYYDNDPIDGKWYGENNVARATNSRPKAPSRRSSSQPSYRSDNRKGYADSTVSRRNTTSRPQFLARRSSSQPNKLNDNGQSSDRNAQSTAISRRKSRPQAVTRRSSSQPDQRRNSGGSRELQNESTALSRTKTRPQGITRRSSSQPRRGGDDRGENFESQNDNTTMTRTMTRPQGMIRRSSSQPSQQSKRGEDYDGQISSTEVSRTNTRPQAITRRSSSQPSQQGNRGNNRPRFAESTVSRRGNTRPNMARRSSSHPGHGKRDTTVARRANHNSDSEGEGHLQNQITKIEKRVPGSGQEKSRDRFSKTPTGLGAGVVGAMVGGWAAKKAYEGSNIGRQRRASSGGNGSGSGTGGALMTLVGATVAGVAFNTVIDRLEEKNMVKQVGKGEVVTLVKYTGKAANAVIDHLAEERARNLRESEGRYGGSMGYGGGGREHGGRDYGGRDYDRRGYGGREYDEREYGGRDRGDHRY